MLAVEVERKDLKALFKNQTSTKEIERNTDNDKTNVDLTPVVKLLYKVFLDNAVRN